MTGGAPELFDYHGALVVVETDNDEIVFIHPPGGEPEAPASLPSNPCDPGEAPEDAAVRIVREMTGLEVEIARVTGDALIDIGPEGPVRSYPLDDLPAIIPIRVANQRALHAYLEQLNSLGSLLS